jgi:hypothetical protein
MLRPGKEWFEEILGKKFPRTHLKQYLGGVAYACPSIDGEKIKTGGSQLRSV